MTVHIGRPLGAPAPIPGAVLLYGLAGVLPFLACPLAGVLWSDARGLAAVVLATYGALILSFLGGARWGLEGSRAAPSPKVVGVAMLPTLVGLALLTLTGVAPGMQLLGLAAALVAVWVWDLRGSGLPGWYGRLRSILTQGAVVGLCAGAAVLHG
jgi:hypothetical protein